MPDTDQHNPTEGLPADAVAVAADSASRADGAYADDLFCPECGYSLRGLTSERCPECGLDLGFIEATESLIPWERRREIGRVRAYWRTVLLATFRPRRFCRAAYQDVSYRDAQLFRWLSIGHVIAGLLAVIGVVALLTDGRLFEGPVEETGWWFVGLVGLCGVLALVALTGIPSYFFHPRYLPVQRQNRAVALSYYACAPLNMMLPLGVLASTAFWGHGPGSLSGDEWVISTILVCGALALVLATVVSWFDWSRFACYLLQRGGRRLAVTWLMPPLSVITSALILVGLPIIAYFLAVVFYSLR